MSRVLKSYPKALVRDDDTLPPILHPFQSPAPQQLLVNCRTLLRMWENRAPGSEVLVRETIQREMSRVFQEHHSYDHITLLSACQAYLLYSIYLFFCTDSDTSALVDTATMINLQELASSMSLRLYPCDAESAAEPPDWDAWIVAEAKRRTLYTMYTFDHVHNYLHDTTSYIGTELGHLPLPAAKGLWAATTASAWRAEYARFSAEWPTSPLLEDLWPDPEERVVRRERADRWVESADEFGMFMFAIANVTFDL
ncbi:MFS general substrate transporter [Mycena sanguinolenta]|nr:MFS general substrate transporter [Mycena sanguinolenta]